MHVMAPADKPAEPSSKRKRTEEEPPRAKKTKRKPHLRPEGARETPQGLGRRVGRRGRGGRARRGGRRGGGRRCRHCRRRGGGRR